MVPELALGGARLVSSPYRERFILRISARPEPAGPLAWGVSAPLLGRSWAAYCSGLGFQAKELFVAAAVPLFAVAVLMAVLGRLRRSE